MEKREKRKRMIQKKIRLTEEEARFISTKVSESGMANFNSFARIMLIMGEVKILKFDELKETMLDEYLMDEVNHLLELKTNSNEREYIPVISGLNKYIENNMNEIKKYASNITDLQFKWDRLNQYFLKLLKY